MALLRYPAHRATGLSMRARDSVTVTTSLANRAKQKRMERFAISR
jgi:hypothetical protein